MCPPADTNHTVMIVSDDATPAALLGGLVETLGYHVAFTAVRESPERLRRVRPRVCMLDCDSDACGEDAVAHAMMRGVCVVLVGPRDLLNGMRELASRHGVEMIFTPPEPGPLADVLERAVRRTS